MGIYVYKTLAKHVKTDLGNVHEAKYVTKMGCSEPSGRGGKEGEHLFAYGLEELETVYLNKGNGGGFWHDGIDFKVMGYLRKRGRSWVVSQQVPTKGEWIAREAKSVEPGDSNKICFTHECSRNHEIMADRFNNMFRVSMLINSGEGTRKVSHITTYPHTLGTFVDKHLFMATHIIDGSLAYDGSVVKHTGEAA